MKYASWAIAGCLIAGGLIAQPANAQQTAQKFDLPAGSVGTMASNDPSSHYSPYVNNPSPQAYRAAWGLDVPNKSHDSSYIVKPTQAQVEAAWGKVGGPGKSFYNPFRNNFTY
jgi:hypothetical protein